MTKSFNNPFLDEENYDLGEIEQLPCRKLVPNPFQPRKVFDDVALHELADSIAQHGILQPITVRQKDNKYEIIAGERRFRAARLAGLQNVPVIIREFSEAQMMELALLENLQRENLTPIEEAEAYERLLTHLNFTQEQLAKRVGKSRPHVANHLRLLKLPVTVREAVNEGKLTMGHGRALVGVKNTRSLEETAKLCMKEQWNVRQLESYIQKHNRIQKPKLKQDIFTRDTEQQLREFLGTNVAIKQHQEKGKIEIDFYSQEDLNRLVAILLQHEE